MIIFVFDFWLDRKSESSNRIWFSTDHNYVRFLQILLGKTCPHFLLFILSLNILKKKVTDMSQLLTLKGVNAWAWGKNTYSIVIIIISECRQQIFFLLSHRLCTWQVLKTPLSVRIELMNQSVLRVLLVLLGCFVRWHVSGRIVAVS